MIEFIEKKYQIKFFKLENAVNAQFIYFKRFNLEMLIKVSSLKLYKEEIELICGEYKKGASFYSCSVNLCFDIVLCGMAKIRFLDLKNKLVKSYSKKTDLNSAQMDANIRLQHPLLPVPKVYEVNEEFILEELIVNTNTQNYLLTHPKNVLQALELMKPAVISSYEKVNGRYIAITNGQLYKNDHVLINKEKGIYLVDWSEGGHKDRNGKYFIFFDCVSSIKWTIFARRFNYFYYYKYIDSFLYIILDIAINLDIKDWKKELLLTIDLLVEDGHPFNSKSFLLRNFKRRINEVR